MPVIKSHFRPAWWLRGAHAQTIWSKVFHRNPGLTIESQRVELPDGDFIDLAWSGPIKGKLIHHSDRGGQYTSDDFRNELARHGIEASMSSTGNCYDNAVAESFFGLLKRERINRVRYRTREEARADVFEYIEVFYNRKRRHGFLGNISPAEFEHKTTGLYETVH